MRYTLVRPLKFLNGRCFYDVIINFIKLDIEGRGAGGYCTCAQMRLSKQPIFISDKSRAFICDVVLVQV